MEACWCRAPLALPPAGGLLAVALLITACVLIQQRPALSVAWTCFALAPVLLSRLLMVFPQDEPDQLFGRLRGKASFIGLSCDDGEALRPKSLTAEISQNHTLLFDLGLPTPNAFSRP